MKEKWYDLNKCVIGTVTEEDGTKRSCIFYDNQVAIHWKYLYYCKGKGIQLYLGTEDDHRKIKVETQGQAVKEFYSYNQDSQYLGSIELAQDC